MRLLYARKIDQMLPIHPLLGPGDGTQGLHSIPGNPGSGKTG